jgi:two-component system CheB/CheR fusion protein
LTQGNRVAEGDSGYIESPPLISIGYAKWAFSKPRTDQTKKQKKHPEDDVRPPTPEDQGADFTMRGLPIIGIGASAGGLQALEAFLGNTPSENGMAFVIVQHLDPNRESILADLLRRHTAMPVFQVTDNMQVQPNNVYGVPTNRNMALFHGTLLLTETESHGGLRLPVDFLFRSLAEDQGQQAIGIIHSRTGSDGTLGLKAIRGEGGMVIAQDPESAKFDGMPRSAIATSLVDYVLSPEEMAAQLIEYAQHLFTLQTTHQSPHGHR